MIWAYGQDGQGLHRGKARGGGESCTSTGTARSLPIATGAMR